MSKKKKAARAKNKAKVDKVTRQCRPEEKYKFCKTLGTGKFAKVKRAIDRETGKEFAIKIIDTDSLLKLEHRMIVQLVTEISIMDYIRHPNVLRLYDLMAYGDKVYLVLECAPGGDLHKKMHEKGRLEEAVARKYFQQLIHAVDYMHSKGVCHRDLKLGNLLLDSNGDLKVADFGLGTVFLEGPDGKLVPWKWGTRAFTSPEAMEGHPHDGSKSDVWSCGVILFTCIAGRLPFNAEDDKSLVKKMSRAKFSFPGGFSDAAMDLIRKILDPNPTTRITTTDIMKTDWFNEGGGFHSLRLEDLDVSCVQRWPLLLKTMGLPKLLCDLEEEEEEINVFHTVASRCNLNSLSKNEMIISNILLSALEKKKQSDVHVDFSFGPASSGRPVRQTIFTCMCPAEVLISIIREAAKSVGLVANWVNLLQDTLNLWKLKAGKGKYKLKLQEKNIEVLKDQLAMKIEFYKLLPSDPYFMVEFSKSKGDTLEFHKVYEEIYTFFKLAIGFLTEKVKLEKKSDL